MPIVRGPVLKTRQVKEYLRLSQWLIFILVQCAHYPFKYLYKRQVLFFFLIIAQGMAFVLCFVHGEK